MSPIPIDTVGVWDTVGALGIPDYTSSGAVADLFRFANTILGPGVSAGLHAISRTSNAAIYTNVGDPMLDNAADSPALTAMSAKVIPRPILKANSRYLALERMTALLGAQGVRFAAAETFKPAPNACGCAHEPWLTPPIQPSAHSKTGVSSNAFESPSVQARRDSAVPFALIPQGTRPLPLTRLPSQPNST